MLNLLERWRSMIDSAIEQLLQKAKKKKLIKEIPEIPKLKVNAIKEAYKKNPSIIETVVLYEFFKRAPNAEKIRENEFRKNVTLKIMDMGKWVDINIDKLKEYSALLERFISSIKQVL